MYGAFFATTVGRYEDEATLTYHGENGRLAQIYKERIIYICQDLVRIEAEIGITKLPALRERLMRLYPSENWQDVGEIDRVRDRLISHYDKASDFLLAQTVEPTWWGRAAELKAAAIYLREPIYVHNDQQIQVQCYSYRDETGPDGVTRELGIEVTTSMTQFTHLVDACLQHSVIPTVLVLNHGIGTQHFRAMRFADHLYHVLDKEKDETHPNMRERLDEVHRILEMAAVKASTDYNFDSQPSIGSAKRRRGRPRTRKASVKFEEQEQTSPPSQIAAARKTLLRADERVYARVLALCGNISQGSIADRSKHMEYSKANLLFMKQGQQAAATEGTKVATTSVASLRQADYKDEGVFAQLKCLFYQLPYPAIMAQALGVPTLVRWGEHQAVRAQCNYLLRISQDKCTTPRALTLIGDWLTAIKATSDEAVR
jgi:hypothetical protein